MGYRLSKKKKNKDGIVCNRPDSDHTSIPSPDLKDKIVSDLQLHAVYTNL